MVNYLRNICRDILSLSALITHGWSEQFGNAVGKFGVHWYNMIEFGVTGWGVLPGESGRGGGMADALRSGRSVRTDMWVQLPPSAPK